MNKEKSKLTDFKKNTENPFLKEAIKTVKGNIVRKYKTASKTGEKAILKAVDESTGEILGHTQFIRQIEVDEEKFAKMYLSNFSAFFDLKPSAIKVFGYILTRLVPNKDEFMFLLDDCVKFTEYKTPLSVHQGLAQLLKSNIIARGKTDFLYFINPMVVFNGNRITFAKTYVKKKKNSKEIDPAQTNLIEQIKEIEGKGVKC